MVETIIAFAIVAIIVIIAVRYLVRSEVIDKNAEDKVSLYCHSRHFQQLSEKNPFWQVSKLVLEFERRHPKEVKRLYEVQKKRNKYFKNKKRKYDFMVFKFQEVLVDLRETGKVAFKKEELLNHVSEKALREMVESNLFNFYGNEYLLKDKYEAAHPFEVDENGVPKRIEL